jgi:hypothetical protein
MDWLEWHRQYDDPNSSLTRRLQIVQGRIAEALDRCPPGPIRVLSICAGDGRDLLGVLASHPRAADVVGRLVEWDENLAERARAAAPPGIEILRGDAGISDAYADATPADLLLSCGVFGNISDEDIRATIAGWRSLCAPNATVIWTRGVFSFGDLRDQIRQWATAAGFEELSFDGPPESFGVGVARMTDEPEPFQRGVRLFHFLNRTG